MSTIAYLRFSTDKQDERQQLNTIQKYLEAKGMRIDKTFMDEGISGGTSYTKRNLFNLCNDIKENDIVVVSEVSRITRSGIAELSEIIEKYFKPNHLRLIICNVGLDIDCSDINPMVEMQLMMLATFSKIEKQLIQERTKSALETRKQKLKKDGSFISKAGRECRALGRPKGCEISPNAINASRNARRSTAQENPHNLAFKRFMAVWESEHGQITRFADISDFVAKLNALNFKTARGLPFDENRARAMAYKIKNWELEK